VDVIVTIAEYTNQLKARGYAQATMKNYSWGLDQFKCYLVEHNITDIRKVTRQVIVDYQAQVMTELLARESKALKIRPVKRLFEYLIETHKLLINPADGIVETSRRNRKIGLVLSLDEMKRLLAQPNLSLRTHLRDRALMEVMYSSGIRLDELIRLEVYHADIKEKVLYIRKAKGRKQRVVPLGKAAGRYLKQYLGKVRPHYARMNPKTRTLFLNTSGLALSPSSIRQIIRKHRIAAGIKKPVSPHTLRRTCATHLMQNGADIRYIQKLLGHKYLKTTQDYTKVMPVEVKTTHNKTHPGKDL
jgi:site-specific recombinase XerD